MLKSNQNSTFPASDKGAQPNATLVETALDSVLNSEAFSGATRLQSFLRHVVEEGLAGRGGEIRAKSVAEDVYGRVLTQGPDPLAVVRVDAGRLRRRLSEYYATSGRNDPLRIHIDTGGYAPRFEVVDDGSARDHDLTSRAPFALSEGWRLRGVTAAGIGVVLIALVYASGVFDGSPERGIAPSELVERDALYATSPAKLQAVNLAEDAWQLMFPAFDRARLEAALRLFEQVIQLDPEYYGGFAGVSQIQAIAAAQMPDSDLREQAVARAIASARRAVDLAPTTGLAHSSLAMARYAARDCSAALSQSDRALSLSPQDLYVLNSGAIVSLFCGEFERALQVSEPQIGTSDLAEELVFRNVAASADFHLGNYQKSIDRYGSAVQSGSPVGALTVAYQAASLARLGQIDEAEKTLELFAESWPNLSIENVLKAIFADPDDATVVLDALAKL